MSKIADLNTIPLPKDWPKRVRSAILHVISLAHLAITSARALAAQNGGSAAGLRSRIEQLENEVELLKEEIRIKDARMASVEARHRPHYRPRERLAILVLRAARGWSRAETADHFLLQPATISSWTGRIDETGKSALVQTRQPVNKFPDFVGYLVRRLKILAPTLGKKRIAQILARAGLHLGVTTVGRILKEKPELPQTEEITEIPEGTKSRQPVRAKHANHLWQVDLTAVATTSFWVPWVPFRLPQVWPFCWWVACVVDHFSRRFVSFTVFSKEPTSLEIRKFLGSTMSYSTASPKYILADKGKQFWCEAFKDWCRGKGIDPRYGSAGQRGATAVIERFILSLKTEWLRRIQVSFSRQKVRQQITWYLGWYNEHRPSQSLDGRTPNEVHFTQDPANEQPRYEPRTRWPKRARCATPHAKVKGKQGSRLNLELGFHQGSKQLPILELKQAA